ncbi:MAG TPA: DUF4124 domain-containing protein [Fluviicoccus sp.]|nr:DUF4124 domain-containing protein [Fluviicoccus sp.]
MRRMVLAAVILMSGHALAGIYKTYDKNGNVVYSDDPAGGAESVQTRETMVVPALPKQVIDNKLNRGGKSGEKALKEPVSYQVKISKPAPDQQFQHGDPAFNLEFSLTPDLWKTHHFEVYLNGERISRDNYSPSLNPEKMSRGDHRLEIRILNERGQKITAEGMNFSVFQGSEIAPSP